jgi:hypothetical protein
VSIRRTRCGGGRRGHLRVGAALSLSIAVAATGCGIEERARPDCRDRYVDTLVLMAQSVPTAELVPCLDTLPAGWTFEDSESDQDSSELVLSSDRGGMQALVVTLQRHCDHSGADQVPSDEPGTRRYERIRALAPSYSSVRYYEFEGGCVVYDIDLDVERVSGLVNEASLMLGFVSRDALHDQVERQSDGRIDDAP